MPKQSKKSKSKRVTLKQKYKVIKKVREHHRKKKKELKKLGKRAPKVKDPGIPSQWPFKEELIKELAWKRQQILMQEKEKREERKRAREERAATDGDAAKQRELEAVQQGAAAKQKDFEVRKKARLTAGGGAGADQDGSRRAFYKEFRRVVEASDVVIQVLDARDPEGCRCPDVERYVRSLDHNKRVILLLNKMDLVPREVGEKWLKYYRQELPAVAFKSSTQQQGSGLSARGGGKGGRSAAAAADGGSGCLGADTLLQLLKNYARNRGIKASITVGVVGLPNVGKSSLINSLKRARVAQVGNTPGVTRGVQEVVLDKSIRLLDSPGIIFSTEDDAAAVLRNAVKVERLSDPLAPVAVILDRISKKQLMEVYKIPAFADVDEFLRHIAAARGKLKRGGIPDMLAAARIVLQDWNGGAIPFYTLPPSRGNEEHESAQVVAQWAEEFDTEKVFAAEAKAVIAHLPSMEVDGAAAGSGAGYFQANSAGRAKVDLPGPGDDMEASSGSEGDEEDGGEDGMEEDDGDHVAKRRKAGGAAAGGKGAVAVALYSEEGQFNPHKARAEKKAKKKAKAAPDTMAADGEGSDFDFDEANEGGEGGGDGSGGDGSGSGSGSEDEYGAAGDEKDADAAYADDMEGSDIPEDDEDD